MPAEFGVPIGADVVGTDLACSAALVADASPGGFGPQAPSHSDKPIVTTTIAAFCRLFFGNTISLKNFSKLQLK
jgi:hypothetical protein